MVNNDYWYRAHWIVSIIVLRQRMVATGSARMRSQQIYFNIDQQAAGYNCVLQTILDEFVIKLR